MPQADADYYATLGVSRDATEEDIRKAYHRLAMQWHPDRNRSPEAEEKFKAIAKAYAVLKDPKKRAQYDARGAEGVAHYSAQDLFGDMDFGDLFGDMGFGFGGGSIFNRLFGRRPARRKHGRDLHVRIEVPLEVIDRGGQQSVRASHPATCDSCHGYATCSGTAPPLCSVCHGKGTEVSDPCPTCGGYGQVEKEELIKVDIPQGIEEGVTLRVAGHGLPGETPDIPPGDLYVAVYAKPDGRFQRRGADLWRAERIAVVDAVLGSRIAVATLAGTEDVNIPPGTQPDDVLRLKGKGLSRYRKAGRGDLHVRLQVQLPERLSAEERQLY